ncbi:MFS transporter [Aquirufa lenticrescens]|uniref:MFS transporter n=1 Tax=Aquirufa lenticrescens TaxID=2696560 RepID=UPI001CAA58A3|nr:MFS transporter [Aquirufa lenticrescens]UAJ14958.1 MFS transporter [Aquirufa lenticrescens]
MEQKLNNPKTLNAWAFYDWANSVHSLTITSAIFPIYFPSAAITLGSVTPGMISILGFELSNTVVFSYTISVAFLALTILMPFLSGIADYTGAKKSFMRFFCYLGSFSCIALFFFSKGHYYIGTLGFLFSIIGWGGSMVFYNSFLPEIATPDRFDRLSAKGFTLGYIGSVLLLIQNLTMLLKPEWYGGIGGEMAARVSFLTVGLWWLLFAQIPLHHLPDSTAKEKDQNQWWLGGFKELQKVFREVMVNKEIKLFLVSFFLFNMGAQTVMYLGALFGSQELHLPEDALIITILLIQLVAIPGAYFCARLSGWVGNVKALGLIVFVWIFVCAYAYTVTSQFNFYLLATAIGFVMGGIQSNSRATYAKLCPKGEKDTASYFSFYDVCDRLSTVIGTFMFGLIIQLTGNMRISILVLTFVFAASLLFLRPLVSSAKAKAIWG